MFRLKLLKLYVFLTLTLVAPSNAAWVFEKASGNTFTFKSDNTNAIETLKVEALGPSFIAVLTDPESNTPYVVYEGRTCPTCETTNTSIYIQRLDGKGKVSSYVFPGRISDPKKGLVFQGRTFYGNCLPKVKAGLVSHQLEHVDRRGMQKSVLIAEPGPQYVYEVLLERRLPSVGTTLDFVKRKVCFEIAGKSRSILRKPLNLTPKKGLDDDEEEGDEVDAKGPSSADAPADAPTAGKE
jgi:hypothetical protein